MSIQDTEINPKRKCACIRKFWYWRWYIGPNIPAPLHFNALSEVEIVEYLCCQDNAKTATCCLNNMKEF